jgi:hypothetical protein
VDGEQAEPAWTGAHAALGSVPTGCEVQLDYAVPRRTEHETVEGIEYELQWQGHDIVGIRPNAAYRPFYPALAQQGATE